MKGDPLAGEAKNWTRFGPLLAVSKVAWLGPPFSQIWIRLCQFGTQLGAHDAHPTLTQLS